MAMTAREIRQWLKTLNDNDRVGIDDGGLCLRVIENDSWCEIGGLPESEPAYTATVRILIPPKEARTEAEACDWISGLFEISNVKDWAYFVSPALIAIPKNYEEGDFINVKASDHQQLP
jgi:hypothetical protein